MMHALSSVVLVALATGSLPGSVCASDDLDSRVLVQPEAAGVPDDPSAQAEPVDVLKGFEAWCAPWLTPFVEDWIGSGSPPERLLMPNGSMHRSISDVQLDRLLSEIAATAERHRDIGACTQLLRDGATDADGETPTNPLAATLAAVAVLWRLDRDAAAELAAVALLLTPDQSLYAAETIVLMEVVAAAPDAVVAPAILARLKVAGTVTQFAAHLLGTTLDGADARLLQAEVLDDGAWDDAHPGARCSAAYIVVEFLQVCGEDPDARVTDVLALGIGQGPLESLRAACHSAMGAEERRTLIKEAVTHLEGQFSQHASLLRLAIDRHYPIVAGLFQDPEFLASLTREQRSFVRQIVRVYEPESRPARQK